MNTPETPEYEKKFMYDFINTIKLLKPNLGEKLLSTGSLVEKLGSALNCLDDDLLFAGYYANIGLLVIENLISSQGYISNEKERSFIKEHVYYSSDFLEKRGLLISAEIVKNHHEKPNGTGYFFARNADKRVAIVNIADEFVGLSSSSHYKPHKIKSVAIKTVLEQYITSRLFSRDELLVIENTLSEFYKTIRKH